MAVGPATAGGVPVDPALGVARRVLGAVGGFASEPAGEFLGFVLTFRLGPGLSGGGLRGELGLEFRMRRGLFGVAGLLLEGKEGLAHFEVES